jgi:hypothetical protein
MQIKLFYAYEFIRLAKFKKNLRAQRWSIFEEIVSIVL